MVLRLLEDTFEGQKKRNLLIFAHSPSENEITMITLTAFSENLFFPPNRRMIMDWKNDQN